jgi:ubiquinol-cytochrome c reductase cytochrome c subunit
VHRGWATGFELLRPRGMKEPMLGGRRLGLVWTAGEIVALSAVVAVSAAVTVVLAPRASGAQSVEVAPLYQSDCAVCHGASARGTDRGPSLQGVGRGLVDFELSTGRMPLATESRTTESGRPDRPLPGVQPGDPDAAPQRAEPAYPPATIAALVDYVAQLGAAGGPDIPVVAPGDQARGGEAFRQQCAACHEWAGEGGALFQREAPGLKDATAVQIAEAVRGGPGQMPAFGSAALDDQQVNDVVAYVRYLDHPKDRGGFALWHLGPVAEGAMAMVSGLALALYLRWIGQRG